jgi:enoyl-CoA hydratase/carnithine racemase
MILLTSKTDTQETGVTSEAEKATIKPDLRIERRGAGLWLTLSRPADMNALNLEILKGIERGLGEALEDDGIRAVVVTGDGRAFCAGADLKTALGGLGDRGLEVFLDEASRTLNSLRNFPKPVIAGLNGLTLAGGLELALACDIIVAAANAKVGDGHANYGVFPGAGGAAILPRRIGYHGAALLLFTGDTLPAETLMSWGLIQQIVPAEQLTATIDTLVEKIAQKSPSALRRMKAVARASAHMSEDAALELEKEELRQHMLGSDFREGLAAFAEKRKPKFQGR